MSIYVCSEAVGLRQGRERSVRSNETFIRNRRLLSTGRAAGGKQRGIHHSLLSCIKWRCYASQQKVRTY